MDPHAETDLARVVDRGFFRRLGRRKGPNESPRRSDSIQQRRPGCCWMLVRRGLVMRQATTGPVRRARSAVPLRLRAQRIRP